MALIPSCIACAGGITVEAFCAATPTFPGCATKPEVPTVSITPTVPATPVTPITPITPTDPVVPPVTPGTPVTPTTPVIPATPVTTQPAVQTPPAGFALGRFGQLCATKPNAVCQSTTDIASGTATPGFVKCESAYDCCMCAAVDCIDCIALTAGDSALFGVKAVNVYGGTRGGAALICQGVESCAETIVNAEKMNEVQVTGDMGLKNARLVITDVVGDFKLHCTGMGACEGSVVTIVIPGSAPGTICNRFAAPTRIGAINCAGPEACANMKLNVRNEGCSKVYVEQLACTEPDSCTGMAVKFWGDVELQDCNLGSSGHSITGNGVAQCYVNLQGLLCQDPLSCLGIRKTLTNPKEAFKLHCGATSSCQNAVIDIGLVSIDLPYPDPNTGEWFTYVEWFDGFYCSGPSSCAGATIRVDNNQRGKTLEVENIECSAAGACVDTQIITGPDVEIVDAKCIPPGACAGCVVKKNAADPGIPCIRFDTSLNNI